MAFLVLSVQGGSVQKPTATSRQEEAPAMGPWSFSVSYGRAARSPARDPHIWPVTQQFGCFNWH